MITHIHYDDETLTAYALDRLDDNHDEVAAHLERCEVCQAKLETISCSDLGWEEIGDLLKDESDVPMTACSDRQTTYISMQQLLEPTEQHDSFGRFARYEILEWIGRGGMGVVMRGYDTSLNRHCAIKVLAPELASSAAARSRFSREAKSAAAVVHPHVVPIHTVGEHNGLPYLVMPVVEGDSLQRRVDRDGPLELVAVVRIAMQIAEGIAAAHEQGLVHRDIKPANILLNNGVERVQITDFGLARTVDDASMTRSGVVAGTPQYMSPEQAHGDLIDHRSDLFSFGSCIYYMLTGRSPFRAETTMGVLNRIINDDPRSLRSIQPTVPVWLEAIVMRLLAKRPSDRFQTAQELADMLERCLAHLQQPSHVSLPESLAVLPQKEISMSKYQRTTTRVFGTRLSNQPILLVLIMFLGAASIAWMADAAFTYQRRQAQAERALLQDEFLVDQEAFSPGKGRLSVPLDKYASVKKFVTDYEQMFLSIHVPEGSYGEQWVLIEGASNRRIALGSDDKPLSLSEAGISAGVRLKVERLN